MTSFVIVNNEGKAILEIFDSPKARANLAKLKPEFKAVPIGEYLASLNKSIKAIA
jgi:hypothetical protein